MDSENSWFPYIISVNKILHKNENFFNKPSLIWAFLNVFKTEVNIDSNFSADYVTQEGRQYK